MTDLGLVLERGSESWRRSVSAVTQVAKRAGKMQAAIDAKDFEAMAFEAGILADLMKQIGDGAQRASVYYGLASDILAALGEGQKK